VKNYKSASLQTPKVVVEKEPLQFIENQFVLFIQLLNPFISRYQSICFKFAFEIKFL
jgi:hypothetical protein